MDRPERGLRWFDIIAVMERILPRVCEKNVKFRVETYEPTESADITTIRQ